MFDMDVLDISGRLDTGYYNEIDNSGSGGAIRFWRDDIDGEGEITPDYQQNYTRLTGASLNIQTMNGTVNKIVVVNEGETELTISGLNMLLKTFNDYVEISDGPSRTQAFLSDALNGNDVITGSDLGDVLRGFTGKDTLTGGAGADAFVFDTALNSSTNVDNITDFSSGDTIHLDDAIFTNVDGMNEDGLGTLTEAAFANWDSRGDKIDQADDRIIYRHIDSRDADTLKDTVYLYYDATGGRTGDAVLFATLTNQASAPTYDVFTIF
jgi:serralysin